MRRLAIAGAAAAFALGCGGGGGAASVARPAPVAGAARAQAGHVAAGRASAHAGDWPMFGRSPSRTSSTSASIGIGVGDVPHLRRQTVELPGTVDSSPIFLGAVRVAGATRDAFFMTTTYGRTLALDAASGRILWTFTPGSYAGLAGSYRITNASPVASADRRWIFAASPDGRVHKLSVASGREAGGRWPIAVTRLPAREKLASSLGLVRGRVLVATGGYIGDAPPYQGHLVALDDRSGRAVGVLNTLCADRHRIVDPGSCPSSDSAIWARSGAVLAPDGSLLVATGNGPFDGRRDFGDSVLRISATARRLLGSWTPSDQAQLEAGDTDLGSTAPAVIGGGSILQAGKDGKLHVVSLAALRRRGSIGRERQVLPAPGGGVFSAPAVWRNGERTLVFVTTFGGTAGYEQRGGLLRRLWGNDIGGTSPIVAGGLLYVYDPGGQLDVYRPASGELVARLAAARGHWNSPVPGHGVIALPEGDANDHRTSGTLSLYRP
jgi:outer membrane protein assembly factor BamB